MSQTVPHQTYGNAGETKRKYFLKVFFFFFFC
uniref:Uncharacterized protein n=1 Tax=Anguilla anguilla TaxID=7936 RepID=A0A0E9VMD5_ANGAN